MPLWLSEGLLIAFATLSGYSVTLSYHRGVAAAFGTPDSLITITPSAVFSSFLFVGTSLLTLTLLSGLVHVRTTSPKWELDRHPVVFATVLATSVFFSLAGLAWETQFIHALIGALPVLTMTFAEWSVDRSGPDSLLPKKTVIMAGLGLALVMWGYLASFTIGVWAARMQTTFYVVEGSPEQVVLVAYGDTLVCAPLLRAQNQFRPEYVLRKLVDPGGPVLRRERIGSLTIAPVTPQTGRKGNAPLVGPPAAAATTTP